MRCGQFVFVLAILGAAALAACGASATSVPAAPVVTAPTYPIGGATYTYAVESWAEIRPAAPATPAVSPTIYATQAERVTAGGTFDGQSGLIDVRTVYREPSTVETTDEYLQWVPIAGRQGLKEVGETSLFRGKAEHGSSQTTFTTVGPSVEVPFAPGKAWDAATAYHQTFSGTSFPFGKLVTSRLNETWNADGSYDRNALNYPFIVSGLSLRTIAHVGSDGSSASTYFQSGRQIATTSIGLPERTTGGAYAIPLVDPFGHKADIPDWYPGHALPPSPLVASSAIDRGQEMLAASCRVPHAIATRAEAIVRTNSQFDPNGIAGGSTDTAYYVAGIGMVCDVQTAHYLDYSVVAPAAIFEGESLYRSTTSLTHVARPAAEPAFADSLAFAVGAAVADGAQRRMKEALTRRPRFPR